MKKKIYLGSLILGAILFVVGIILSVNFKNPHFYTPFSIGLFLLSDAILFFVSGRGLFYGWKPRQHLVFWILMIVSSLITDKIGMFLGYWHYPHYSTLGDELLKIIFEFAVSLVYFLGILLIVKEYVWKIKNTKIRYLCLIFTPPIVLLFTEYINSFSDSWVFTIPKAVLLSIGAWLMALIPLIIYKLVDYKGVWRRNVKAN